jgi:hypothetical protein
MVEFTVLGIHCLGLSGGPKFSHSEALSFQAATDTRTFDPRDGRIGAEPIHVLTLSETIVPALISAAAPIVAGDQMIVLLGNYRGDIWITDV